METPPLRRKGPPRADPLVAGIPGAVYRCACDAAWTMDFLSDAIAEITGYPADEFIDNRVRSYASVIHPDDRVGVDAAVHECVEARRPYEIDYRIIDARGAVKDVHERGQGLFGPDGSLVWLVGVIYDNTDRRRADLARRNADRLDLIRGIAAGIAHNFNNLLSGIGGFAAMARREMEAAGLPLDNIDTAIDISSRASRFAGQVRLVAETGCDIFTTIDLCELAGLLLAERAPALPPNVTLETVIHPEPLTVRAAEDKLEMVFRHLVDNALEAMPGGGTLTVRVEPTERPSDAGPAPYAELTVADTGRGMEAEVASRAFAPFSSTKQTVGVGLSLAVVQNLVANHGGQIEVQSSPGSGAAFRVLLPLAEPQPRR